MRLSRAFLTRLLRVAVCVLLSLPGLSAAGATPDTVASRVDYDWFWAHTDQPFDSAVQRLNHGLAIAKRAGDTYAEIGYYNSRGWLGLRQSDWIEAHRYLAIARERATATNDPRRLWQTYMLLGITVSAERNDQVLALRYFEQALAAAEKYGRLSPESEADIRVRVVSGHAQLGHRGEAARLGGPTLNLLRARHDSVGEVTLRSNWAQAIVGKAPDSALILLAPVFKLLRPGERDAYARTMAEVVQIEAHSHRGDCAIVLATAPALLRRAGSLQMPEARMQLLQQLVDCQKKTAPQAAIGNLEYLMAVKDSQYAANNSAELARQQTRFDVAAQDARIKGLEQEQRIARLRAERAQTRTLLLLGVIGTLAALLFGAAWFYRRLRRSEAAARLANRTKDQLMGIIGHDLRGPVANFQQAMPLVKYYALHPNPAELGTLADELTERAQQFGTLLDNLLHWSRTHSNEVRNLPEAVAAADTISAATALYRPSAQAKGVTLHTTTDDALPPVWADPKLLATVLRNLVNNAVKFTPSGGAVTTSVARTPDGHLQFAVRDTGVGMTTAQLTTLFDAEADRSTRGTAGEGGTGLGLLICRHFVALMGGNLQVNSQPGQGTTFAFTLSTNQPIN
jgi:signal transduction histidine kinase